MATLSIPRQIVDNEVSDKAQLEAAFSSIEALLNVTKLDADNIQNSAISENKLASNAITTVKVQDGSVLTDKLGPASVTAAKLNTSAAGKLLPVGAIVAYPNNTPPTGYLLCDGSTVSRTTYSALFAIIGTSHGNGDGSTTFHLPDARGRFIRGVDGAAGRDTDASSRTASNAGGATGNNAGTLQADAVAEHNHNALEAVVVPSFTASQAYAFRGGDPPIATSSITTSGTSGLETRPKNVYENYIIRVN